jgi:hypothetical protein
MACKHTLIASLIPVAPGRCCRRQPVQRWERVEAKEECECDSDNFCNFDANMDANISSPTWNRDCIARAMTVAIEMDHQTQND